MISEVGAILIAVVLVVSASAKCVSPFSAAPLLTVAGLPFPRALSVATIPIEFAVAVAVVWGAGVVWILAVVASGVVFAMGAVLAGSALRRSAEVSCGCFGPLSAAPVSRSTIARNLMLTALSVVTLVLGLWMTTSPLTPVGSLAVAVLLAVCGVGAIVAALVRRRRSESNAAVGVEPVVWTAEHAGEGVRVRIVLSPTCAQCLDVVHELIRMRERGGSAALPELVSVGSPEDTRQAFGDTFTFHYADRTSFLAEYDLIGTPVALVERPDQQLELVYGEFQIRRMLVSDDG